MTRVVENLKYLIRENKVSQAKMSRYTGYTAASISKWFDGSRKPSIDAVVDMANAIGYDVVLVKRTTNFVVEESDKRHGMVKVIIDLPLRTYRQIKVNHMLAQYADIDVLFGSVQRGIVTDEKYDD